MRKMTNIKDLRILDLLNLHVKMVIVSLFINLGEVMGDEYI